jgi:lysophospholipase L1-like esterase
MEANSNSSPGDKTSHQNAIKSVFERHPILTLSILLFFALIITTLGTEKYFAYKHKVSAHGGIERSIRLRENAPLQSDYAIPDDNYLRHTEGLIKKEHLFRMDENGFVHPSKIHEHPDYTLVFIGGSTTECQYNDENNRFPYLAGRLLEHKTGKQINSYNSGVSGNTTMHANDLLLNKIIPLHPSAVVLMENFNDAITLMYEKTYWNANPFRSLIIVNPEKSSSALFSLFKDFKNLLFPNLYTQLRNVVNFTEIKRRKTDEFGHLRGKTLTINEDAIFEQYANSIQTFLSISQAWKIQPVLMTQFNRYKEQPDEFIKILLKDVGFFGISYETMKKHSDRFNQIIRELGNNNNVLVIDLDSLVPKEKKYMYDIVHLNDSGSQFVADIIANKISKIVLK